MPIVSKLKVVMADRDVSVNELSEKVGRSAVNLSHLRCNHSKGIRISLLEDLCRELHCQPGDLLLGLPNTIIGHTMMSPKYKIRLAGFSTRFLYLCTHAFFFHSHFL